MSSRRRSGSGRSRSFRTTVVVGAVGVVVLGVLAWVGYQYFWSNVFAAASYRQQVAALRASWRRSPTSAASTGQTPGAAIAVLSIPALGAHDEVPILAGTDPRLLNRGVGHYPSTAWPGQVGNCALAGLRVTHGQPFARLHELRRGDEVVIESQRAIFTYVLDVAPRDLTVQPSARWVLEPVPGQPGARPTEALLTLTTAQDVLPTGDRSVGFAHLASTQNKQ